MTVLHECRRCGPKDIQLFSPSQMKVKRALCRECMKKVNKKCDIANNVPAQPGYRFTDFVFDKGK